MKTIFGLITISLILSGCSGYQTKIKPLDLSLLDAKKVERASNLYRCSNFLNIFTAARAHRNDPSEHTKLTIEKANSASEIANKILHKSAEGKEINLDRLVISFERKGKKEAYNMVREIGNSSDSNLKDDLFLSCFKTIKQEEAFDTINALSNKLSEPNQ